MANRSGGWGLGNRSFCRVYPGAVAMALFILFFLLALPIYAVISGQAPLGTDYRSADRSSAGIAPAPQTTPDAVIQVYAARALNWRGIFGVHTWIATKPENASEYTIHHVIGWGVQRYFFFF